MLQTESMSKWRHLVGLLICTLFVAAFEYVALVWSFADFHPGYIPDLPEELHRKARIGEMMFAPFERGLSVSSWLADGQMAVFDFVQWIFIPLLYGGVLYVIFHFMGAKVLRGFVGSRKNVA